MRDALPAHERDIGGADRVGVPGERESRFRRVDRAQSVCVRMIRDVACQRHRHPPVPSPRGLADDEQPLHELHPLVGDMEVQQVVRRHQLARR